MQIRVDTTLTHPRELVYRTYQDSLPKLVRYLPNVQEVRELERRREGSQLHLVNLWRARGQIPRVAQGIIKPEMLRWHDYADWDDEDWSVRWRFEMAFMQDRVRVGGRNRFEILGPRRTRLALRGELTIDASALPGVPRFLERRVGRAVERFVLALVEPNLVKTSQGLQRYLDEEA